MSAAYASVTKILGKTLGVTDPFQAKAVLRKNLFSPRLEMASKSGESKGPPVQITKQSERDPLMSHLLLRQKRCTFDSPDQILKWFPFQTGRPTHKSVFAALGEL